MDHKNSNGSEKTLLHHVGNCSKNIIYNHALDNLSEFVLHELCSDKGFNIRKAAYLVHNPDFECLRGVVGYYDQESFDQGSCWDKTKHFSSHMQKSDFNQKVRAFSSMGDRRISDQKVEELVEYLQIDDPAYHTWQSKHNNEGLFIFDQANTNGLVSDHLLSSLHMLSFCPVF